MDLISNIHNVIKYHRKQTGLSQLELANLAGVGKTVIFDIEKGKLSIRFNTLLKILNVLNIKIVFDSPLIASFKETFHEAL